MDPKDSTHLPKQQRSRETLERLLLAAIRVLDELGLDGAVIPRIAAAAGVAPASVYRRFADKDALLRAAFLHLLRRTNEGNRTRLSRLLLHSTLDGTAKRLMSLIFEQYRSHPHLFRALVRFLEANSDQNFVREARSIVAENIQQVVNVLLTHRKKIRHASPERALQIAVLNAVSSIEAIALEPNSLWHTVLGASDAELSRELARGFVAYLRAAP